MVVDLHERLSEFSYGYGVTREAEAILKLNGFVATPFLPSLIHEKDIGFDVGFNSRGLVLLLQFKLGHQLQRFKKAAGDTVEPSPLDKPFWRFRVDVDGHQFLRLREFEQTGAEVFYSAPRFTTWQDFDAAYQAGSVLKRSLLLKPTDIASALGGSASGSHRIVYDGVNRYVCSEPRPIREYTPEQLATTVRNDLAEREQTLEDQIIQLFERARPENGAGRLQSGRVDGILGRARTPLEGMAAVIGIEAWTQGAQFLFVSQPEA